MRSSKAPERRARGRSGGRVNNGAPDSGAPGVAALGSEREPRSHATAPSTRPSEDVPTARPEESGTPDGVMPYEPSAPCAACARGVDPLRAACVGVTESAVHYFCSRACRERHRQVEATHGRALPPTTLSAPVLRHEPSAPPTRRPSLEPVARRIAPSERTTPWWPLLGAGVCTAGAVLPATGLRLVGATEGAAFGLLGIAIVFASRTPLTRSGGGLVMWLATPTAVGLLALAAVLGPDATASAPGWLDATRNSAVWLCAAGASIALMWLREHLLERTIAVHVALRKELAARMSQRVAVVAPERSLSAQAAPTSGLPSATPPRSLERATETLREGDEVLCEAGVVIPVDGVVTGGGGDVLPYPRARLGLPRRVGDTVLAGALVVEGALRVRAEQVGDRRALFAAFTPSAARSAVPAGALRWGERARSLQVALPAVAGVMLLALVSPQEHAAKLASVGAALLALPALALARGTRAAFRAATVAAAARGVRFRDREIIQRAGRMDTAVVRVEGTLVPRVYTLVEIVSLSDAHDTRALLSLALAAAGDGPPADKDANGSADGAREPHAISHAVRAYAESLAIAPATLRRLVVTRGSGVSALTDGQGAFVFGSRAALLAAGVSVAVADRAALRAESSGQRVVFLALGGRVRGLLVFAQEVRNEARAALQTLVDLGLEVELVSGDHRATVESLARTLDVTQFKAELSAEQRAAEVRRLRDGEAAVVALGAAPADELMLTSADLSVCLDAAGQSHRLEAGQPVSYDIITASRDLRDAVDAVALARGVRRQVRLVLGAGVVGLTAALLTAVGLLPSLVAVLVALAVDLRCLPGARRSPPSVRSGRQLREDA